MTDVTVIIHTHNEEKNISESIISAKLLTDKIIIIDMESDDETIKIVNNFKLPIYNFPKSDYVEPARKFGINQVKTDWVLILDADERITVELVTEIKNQIFVGNDHRVVPVEHDGSTLQQNITHYKIPRKNIFGNPPAGGWLKHGGWWPDYQTRLINKKFFVSWPKRIHSTPEIDGKIGFLNNPLVHYFHGDLNSMVEKTIIFEDIESDLLFKANRPTGVGIFFRKHIAELYRRLFRNLGFLDGPFGIIESIYQAFSKTITYLFLYEKQHKKSLPAGRQVGLYDPYLDTLGGGEKHILSILEVFAEQGYEVNIFWDKNLAKEINDRFSLQSIKRLKWLPNIFKNNSSTLRTLQTLKAFDYFFYVTDGSYFFSSAKNNFIFSMVPDKNLYNFNFLNRLKLWNYKFISNSPFTTKWLTKWNIDPITITPYINDELFQKTVNQKEKIILSVGRFFPQLHSKNQQAIISAFKKLKSALKEFADYKLVLAGGLKREDQKYFDDLKKSARDDSSIVFKTNLPLRELYELYKLSNYFWHFTGLGIDENNNPEKVEHLGITPLEAMASGCLAFCYNAGGPKELIKDGENGFLFSDVDELIDKMSNVNKNKTLQENVIKNGKKFVNQNFSREIFREKVLRLIKVRPK